MTTVPQANLLNPALQHHCKYFIGIPALSSIHIDAGLTGFSYNDLINEGSDDSIRFNINNFFKKAHRTDMLTFEFHYNWLSFGFRNKKDYYTFYISEKVDFMTAYPKSLAYLGWYGNQSFTGENISITGPRVNFNYYREFAFGFSREMNENLFLGTHIKVLFGLGNIFTSRSRHRIFTDEDTYELNMNSEMRVNATAPANAILNPDGTINTLEMQELNISGLLLNFNNPGIALDFGFIRKRNSNVTIYGSLLDLGGLYWRKNTHKLSEKSTIDFTGTGAGSAFNSIDYFNNLVDSVSQSFNFKYSNKNYVSTLVPKLIIGSTYKLNTTFYTGLMARTDIYRHTIYPSLTASINARFFKNWNLALSYSWRNYALNNIGFGFSTRVFYIVTDNFYGMMYYKGTRNANIRLGCNIIFGCKAIKKEPKLTYGCYWMKKAETKRNRFEKLKRAAKLK